MKWSPFVPDHSVIEGLAIFFRSLGVVSIYHFIVVSLGACGGRGERSLVGSGDLERCGDGLTAGGLIGSGWADNKTGRLVTS